MTLLTGNVAPAAEAEQDDDNEKIIDWDEIGVEGDNLAAPVNQNPGENNSPAATTDASATTGATTQGTSDNSTPASALDLFLAEHGIVDGKLIYGEQEVLFKDLTPEDQLEVLRQAVQPEPVPLEGDLKHVKDLLDAGKDLREIARDILGDQGAPLSIDELNIRDIKEQYPDFDDAEVQAELEDRQAGRNYEKKSEKLRAKYTPQPADLEALSTQEQARIATENAAERQNIIVGAAETATVFGYEVTDEIRNFVLPDLLEVEENGNSRFVNMQDDPKKMFEIAAAYRMMPLVNGFWQREIDRLTAEHKVELAKARESGQAEMISGFPTRPIATAASTTSVNTRNNQQPVSTKESDSLMTVDEIG